MERSDDESEKTEYCNGAPACVGESHGTLDQPCSSSSEGDSNDGRKSSKEGTSPPGQPLSLPTSNLSLVSSISEQLKEYVLVDSAVGQRRKPRCGLHAAQKDSSEPRCNFCRAEFSITLRRHHCRKCLRVFCRNCANQFVDMRDEERQRAENIIGTTTATRCRNMALNVISRRKYSSSRLCFMCAFEETEGERGDKAVVFLISLYFAYFSSRLYVKFSRALFSIAYINIYVCDPCMYA